MYDIEKIKKEIRQLKMPKEYFRIDLEQWNTHDYYMLLSIRKDSGKTTQSLLLGIVLNKLYGKSIAYMRSDEKQLTRANIETLFDVIIKFNYISKIFNDEYNDVVYKVQTKKFFLCKKDDEGNIIKQSESPLCTCHSLENWMNYKSSFNLPTADIIIFDEFMDTDRQTNRQMVELQNNISTIGREREDVRVLMLGNNINKYCFWFEEFCIEKDIETLNFGGYIETRTDLGTSLYCTLLDLSENKKQDILKRRIRFSGFRTPKMNAFNGLGAWSGNVQPHIPDNEMLNPEYMMLDRLYIRHRNRYVKIKVYWNGKSEYCFLHYSNPPLNDDNVILTLEPLGHGEFYGWGKYAPDKLKTTLFKIIGMREQNKWFYATNSVGELIEDYFNELR